MNKNEYYSKIAQTIIARLKSRQIQGYYCDSKEDARKKALELITEGNSVGWGGSQTIKDIGLMEVIQNGPYVVYDRNITLNPFSFAGQFPEPRPWAFFS